MKPIAKSLRARGLRACASLALASSALCACGGGAQGLSVDSVTPASVVAPAVGSVLSLHGRFDPLLPISLDDGSGVVQADESFQVLFAATGSSAAPLSAALVRYRNDALLEATPPALAAGAYDLIVVAPDGGRATLGAALTVQPAGAAALQAVLDPGPVIAGAPHGLTIAVVDGDGQPVPGYTGVVALGVQPSDPGFSPASISFTAADQGRTTTSVTFTRAGAVALELSDAGGLSGALDLTVAAGALSRLNLGATSAAQVAGVPIALAVQAVDAYDNPVSTSVSISAAGIPSGSVSPASADVDGSATLEIAITMSIDSTAVTLASGGVSAISGSFSVAPGEIDRFALSAPTCFESGSSFPLGIQALDAYGNVADGFNGSANLSVDGGASISPSQTDAFSAGATSVAQAQIDVPLLTGSGTDFTITAEAQSGPPASGTATLAYSLSCP